MNRAQIVLAFDFGLRRIGVAVGDTLTRSSAPHATVPCHDSGPDWPGIDKVIRTLGPDLLVVGAPYNDDGSPGRIAAAADAFAAELGARFKLKARTISLFIFTLVKKGDVDSAAAAVLLAGWLENNRQL